MSFRGGGDAGGRAPSRAGPEYVRNIPKFLQKYEHLLEKREGQRVVRPGNAQGAPGGPDVDEDDDFEDQIRGATIAYDERDPSSMPSSSAADAEEATPWSALKEKGNAAFAQGKLKEAVELFSEAIKLDAKQSVLYSNRSAAHCAAQNYKEALEDARKALEIEPAWGKAHSRLGAALFGLRQFEESQGAYRKACKLEPGNTSYKSALEQAQRKAKEEEEKEAAAGHHTFRKRKGAADSERGKDGNKGGASKKKSVSNILSFSDD